MESRNFDAETVNCFILSKHHLLDSTKSDDILRIIDDIVGLHSTIPATTYLSLLARTKKFCKEYLDTSLYKKRDLGRIRCMRRTVFVLPRKTIPLAFAATRGLAEIRLRDFPKYIGMSHEQYGELSNRIQKILKGKSMLTKEIRDKLNIKSNASFVINLMCDQGILIRGKPAAGWKSSTHTYQLFSEYFPDMILDSLKEEEARAELIRRYITNYGPVTEVDIAWWTGFTKTDVRSALDSLEEHIVEVSITGMEWKYYLLERALETLGKIKICHQINLVPTLDPYTMGYKDRERYVPHEYREYIFDRSGNVSASILLDGRIIGIWDYGDSREITMKFYLFRKEKDDTYEKIEDELYKIGRFMGEKEIQIKECSSIKSLSESRAGIMMHPLKHC